MTTTTRPHSPLTLVSLVCAALMCCLPFLINHHRLPITSFAGEWAAVSLGLVSASLLLRRASSRPFRLPGIAWVPLGMMIVLAMQVAAGLAVYWQQHMLIALYFVWAGLMVALGAELRRELGLEKVVPVLAWAILGGGVLCAAIVGLQMGDIRLFGLVVPHRVSGYAANLGQVNHLANYLALALASLLYLYATARLRTGWAALFTLMLLMALALTGARAGWLYVPMLAAGAWLAGRGTDDNRNRQAATALLLIPAFVLLQLAIPLLPVGGIPAMPGQKVVEGLQGTPIRWQYLLASWQTFLAHPWLGAGFGQFGWQEFLLAETLPAHTGWANHAHNLVFQLLAECGIAGTGIVVGGLALWVFSVRHAPLTAERWWIYALLAVLGLHSLLEYPLWYAFFLGLAALLLGMGEEKFLQWRMDLGPLAYASVLAFGVLSVVNIGINYYTLESWFLRGLTGRIHASQFNQMLDDLTTIRRKSLLSPYIDLVVIRALPNTKTFLADKLAISEQVVRYRPNEQEAYNHALLLALSGRRQEAQQQLRLAMIRHPGQIDAFALQLIRHNQPETEHLLNLVLRQWVMEKAGRNTDSAL